MKKLTITIVTVLLLVVGLGTATFAWITINNMASVRGMRMEVDTTNSLQIEESTEIVEADFTNKIVDPANGKVKYLQPISSVDGLKFFYTQNLISGIDGNGKLNDSAKIFEYDAEDFGLLYENVYPDLYAGGDKVVGYAEYTYILKAYASTENVGVYITDIELINNSTDQDNKTFRVAVLTKQLGADGTFADEAYESQGVITYAEGNVGRSVKNNAEYLAFGKDFAEDVNDGNGGTIKRYVTNYGHELFSEDGKTFYLDAKKTQPYDLVVAFNEAIIENTSETQEGDYYVFTTNKGKTLYGENAEKVDNASYVSKELKAFEFAQDEKINEEISVNKDGEYYVFTTTQNNTIYGEYAKASRNYEFFFKDNDEFVTEFVPYELKVKTGDSKLRLGAVTTLRAPEKVVGISLETSEVLLNDKLMYKFKTNQGTIVYGASQESVYNSVYYTLENDVYTPYVLKNNSEFLGTLELKAFQFAQNEEVVEETSITQEGGYFVFTTTESNTIYGVNAEKANNDKFYYKENGVFVKEYVPYDFTDPNREDEEVTLLNGVTYYKFRTSDGRTVYCVSKTANGPLFNGAFIDEVATQKDTYYDIVKEFDSNHALLELEKGETGYVLVTLRIWIEGEDSSCNNSEFLKLGKDYQLNIDFGVTAPEDQIYLK